MKTSIEGGWVIGYRGGNHYLIDDGVVVFEDDEIVFVGDRYEGEVDECIDASGKLISPGFISTHVHVGMEVMQPFVDLPKYGKGSQRLAPSEEFLSGERPPSLDLESQRLAGEYSLLQMVKSGSTTVLDAHGSGTIWWLANTPTDEEQLVDTVGRIGSRAYLTTPLRSYGSCRRADGSHYYFPDEERGWTDLERAVQFVKDYHGAYDGRVQGMLSPHAVDNCSPKLLEKSKEWADDLGVIIEVHTSQSPREVEVVYERHGCSPVQLLDRIGFLDSSSILGHCVFVDSHSVIDRGDEDLAIIGESGASVAHSPLPFARGGIALESFPRYQDAGINMSIGTDMWPVDMIQEMRLAWTLGKVVDTEGVRPTAWEIFSAATLGGARAIGREDLGRLAPGAKADILIVDLDNYNFSPVLDPIRSLVTCGTARDVGTIFVDGRRIVDNGKAINSDEEKLRDAADSIYQKMMDAVEERDYLNRRMESLLDIPR